MSGEQRVHGDAAVAANPCAPRDLEIGDVREGFIRDWRDDGDRAVHGRQRNGSRRRDFEVELGQVRPGGVERAHIVRNREASVLDARQIEDEAQLIRRDAGQRGDVVASPAAAAEGVGSLGRTACAKRDRWPGATGQDGGEREREEEAKPRRFSTD